MTTWNEDRYPASPIAFPIPSSDVCFLTYLTPASPPTLKYFIVIYSILEKKEKSDLHSVFSQKYGSDECQPLSPGEA